MFGTTLFCATSPDINVRSGSTKVSFVAFAMRVTKASATSLTLVLSRRAGRSNGLKRIVLLVTFFALSALGQSRPRDIAPVLEHPLETPDVVAFQVRQYLFQRAPHLPAAANAAQWTSEAERTRKHLLDDVVFHGWPKAWVAARAITAQDGSPVTIVLNDKGKKAAKSTLSDRLNRGEQVLAVDLLFTATQRRSRKTLKHSLRCWPPPASGRWALTLRN
jgi:hypothetical protein